ncbi:MAG: MoaD/ThiS family protein [Actinobacteria bacterium]|nr:MoaD/ThiS family protein [Actinomycetota bacterium]
MSVARVNVVYKGNEQVISEVRTVKEILEKLGINPNSVIVTVEDELVAEDYVLKNGDKVKIIDVISGG